MELPRARTTLIRLGFALFALSASGACHKRAKGGDSVGIDQPHPPDLLPGRELLATLERSGCYGECPVYRLSVFRDGSVVYVGTRWVKVVGRQEYSIPRDKLDALEGAFTRAGFLQMRDYDHVESTDDDWAHLSYRHGGFTRRVRHYRGDASAPSVLGTLEDDFDRATDSRRFVGSAAASGPVQLSMPALPSAAPTSSSSPAGSAPAASSKPRSAAPSEIAPPEAQE